jgi:gas vesicle protein
VKSSEGGMTVFSGVLLAGVLGLVAGLVLAPKVEKINGELLDKLDDAGESLKQKGKEISDNVVKSLAESKDSTGEAAKDVSDTASSFINDIEKIIKKYK